MFVIMCCSVLLRMRNTSDKFVEKIKTHILRSTFDVITSLVSLEHGVYGWEKVTSQ
jgi:hypothetical protein